MLIWLEADVVIRSRTQGKRSLDDFLDAFFRGEGKPEAKPYTYDELVSALGKHNLLPPFGVQVTAILPGGEVRQVRLQAEN